VTSGLSVTNTAKQLKMGRSTLYRELKMTIPGMVQKRPILVNTGHDNLFPKNINF
jgi:hypothetical protein